MSSPTIMTADEIAAARSRLSQCVTLIEEGNLEDRDIAKMVDDAARVLRSHDALIPPAAPDGEALGRAAWRARATPGGWGRWTDAEVAACMDESWETQSPEERARYQRIGLALHAIGHAAGRSEGEAELARLADALECMRVERDHFCAEKDRIYREEAQVNAEIARLTAELAAQQEQHVADLSRAVEQLTRHDADEAAHIKSLDKLRGHLDLDMFATVDDCADEGGRLASEVERLTAELAEARALHEAVIEQKIAAHAEEIRLLAKRDAEAIEQARHDGAREEREAIVERVRQLAAEGAPGMPEDGDETLVDWIATEIEGRARGEGQGS